MLLSVKQFLSEEMDEKHLRTSDAREWITAQLLLNIRCATSVEYVRHSRSRKRMETPWSIHLAVGLDDHRRGLSFLVELVFTHYSHPYST